MKRMAQVIDGRTMSVGEILGGAAQDSNGAQLVRTSKRFLSPSF
jgi:C-terminal processing protease CtpA/Prc